MKPSADYDTSKWLLENLEAFRYALSLSGAPTLWAAWGNILETRPYLADCLRKLISLSLERETKWYHCGAISKKGHPRHPLYLKKDASLEDFNVEAYAQANFINNGRKSASSRH